MKVKNWIKISFLCCFFVFLTQFAALAAEEKGSITLQITPLAAGTEITLYPIAEFADGNYIYNETFADSGFMIDDLNNTAQAQQAAENLAAYARDKQAGGMVKTVLEDGNLVFEEVSPALYLVAQTKGEEQLAIQPAIVPIPYTSDGEAGWIYEAVLSLKYSFPGGAVIVRKVDEEGHLVGQAEFVLQQKVYAEGSYYWKEFKANLVSSEQGQIVITDMPVGDYRLIETSAPAGFILAETPNYFSIEKAGQVKEIGGVYAAASGEVAELTVVNRQTSVTVNKVDKNGEPVAGAKLVVRLAGGDVARSVDANEVVSFTTTGQPYELKRLPAGNYLLSEVEAPEGYRVSQDVAFTVEDGMDSVNVVTMVDEKEEKTKASLTVTKKLVDQHELSLMAEEDTFYVALFEDEQRTQRVSNVQALHFEGSISESVTFSNLEVGKSYYVGETDEYGVLTEVSSAEDGVYASVYPGSYEVTPTKKEQQKEYTFENMFYELPWGYTYGGSLTITKQVFKGTDACKTGKTFYAAVFKDAAMTERYGDIITLAMGGSSEVSVTIPVYVGESENDSATYYVAETDAEGNVLNASAGLEYEVSLDKTKITMSPSHSEETVTITNAFPDEWEEESESTETEKPEGGSSGGSGTDRTGTIAKTGDNTPVGWYAALLALAAAGIAAPVIWRRKKR